VRDHSALGVDGFTQKGEEVEERAPCDLEAANKRKEKRHTQRKTKMVKCLLATSFLRKRERNDLAAKYDSFHHHLSPIISLYISITFID
jgi:hypothetical protein